MGHYMTELTETQNQERLPKIDSSIFPFVWLKQKIGNVHWVVGYNDNDLGKLRDIAKNADSQLESTVAQQVIDMFENKQSTNDGMIIDIELSYGSGKLLCDMYEQILPQSAVFNGDTYEVKHNYITDLIVKHCSGII